MRAIAGTKGQIYGLLHMREAFDHTCSVNRVCSVPLVSEDRHVQMTFYQHGTCKESAHIHVHNNAEADVYMHVYT